MTSTPRRFTIFDGLMLTIVMAAAAVGARSSWPNLVDHITALEPSRFGEANYVEHVLLGRPTYLAPLNSVQRLLKANVYRVLAVGGQIGVSQLPQSGQLVAILQQCVVVAFPVLVYLSFMLLLLRIVSPRPAWADVLRQPGSVACLALIASLFGTVWVEFLFQTRITMAVASAAVALAWLIQKLTGRWLAEPSWIDRAGRALGVAWIIGGVIALI